MTKLNKLLTNINIFYSLATYTNNFKKLAEDQDTATSNRATKAKIILARKKIEQLSDKLDEYNINDDKLFQYYHAFMDTLDQVLELASKVKPNIISQLRTGDLKLLDLQNAMNDSSTLGSLFATLRRKLSSILEYEYLLHAPPEFWDNEDFEPDKFALILKQLINSTEELVQASLGEDVSLDQAALADMSADIANDIRMENEGAAKFSAEHAAMICKHVRRNNANIRRIGELGKAHPAYNRFISYMEWRKKHYLSLKSDPVRWAKYVKDNKERQAKFQKRKKLRNNLIEILNQETNPKEIDLIKRKIESILMETLYNSGKLAYESERGQFLMEINNKDHVKD